MKYMLSATGKIGDDIIRIVVYTEEEIDAKDYFIQNEFLIIESMSEIKYNTFSFAK